VSTHINLKIGYVLPDMAPKDTDKDKTMKELVRSCLALCEMLHNNVELSEAERLRIENHIHLLHMAYAQWKRRKQKSERSD